MKKNILVASLTIGATWSQAQTKDTISLGTGYSKQVYYSIENGEQASVDLASWDLAFGTGAQGSSVRFNGATGNLLYVYPSGDVNNWATIDTLGIKTWKSIYDTDTSWQVTAFNKVTNDDFDLGWGVYSMITHIVSGDSVYVAKIGRDYKKFFIEKLQGGTYYLVHANLDGSSQDTTAIAKANFKGKNFGYYSFGTNKTLDLEPKSDAWDLVFTKYLAEIPGFGGYGVTGILANGGVEIAKVTDGSKINEVSAKDNIFDFSSKINTIGYKWKTYVSSAGSYTIEDSSIFVIKDVNGKVWNFELQGFVGSSTGEIMFQFLDQSVVGLLETKKKTEVQFFPNPAEMGQNINAQLPTNEEIITISVLDSKGQVVWNSFQNESEISTEKLTPGYYLISVITAQNTFTSRIIIK